MKTNESLLDKTPMIYKLLCNTLADIATLAETVVVVGGQEREGEESRACWQIKSNQMEHLTDIPADTPTDSLELYYPSVCKVPQGFVITGGNNSSLCFMYTAATKSWVRLQDLMEPRGYHGTICVKNVLYVLGGTDENSHTVHSMEMQLGIWQHEPDMPLGIMFPKVSEIDDIIYVLDSERSKGLFQLNADNEWNDCEPLPIEDESSTVSMTAAHGKLFVAGGENFVCAWYQPDTDTWCTGQRPLLQHEHGALVLYSNKLLLLGGSHEHGTDEVEEYDIEADKWTVCQYKMPRKLSNHHAVTLDM